MRVGQSDVVALVHTDGQALFSIHEIFVAVQALGPAGTTDDGAAVKKWESSSSRQTLLRTKFGVAKVGPSVRTTAVGALALLFEFKVMGDICQDALESVGPSRPAASTSAAHVRALAVLPLLPRSGLAREPHSSWSQHPLPQRRQQLRFIRAHYTVTAETCHLRVHLGRSTCHAIRRLSEST